MTNSRTTLRKMRLVDVVLISDVSLASERLSRVKEDRGEKKVSAAAVLAYKSGNTAAAHYWKKYGSMVD